MVISYIHSIFWHMKSAFYELQHRFAKSKCLVLEFEFFSRFFVNILLKVLQVIIMACFYL
jgi:hypothetical protein